MTDKAPPSRIEIAEAIEKHQDGLNGAKTEDIASELNCSVSDLRRRLLQLAELNLVAEEVCNDGSRWRLTGRAFKGP